MLEDLESKAIKAGLVYTEIETKKGIVFKGKQLFPVMMSSFPPGYANYGDTIDGPGILTKPDGYVYEGQFKNNKPHGFGVYESGSGFKFEGTFKDGKKHGMGLVRETKDGPESPVRFDEDKQISWPIP